jgi:hypothetical protein
VVHHGDGVGHGHGLLLVVRDVDEGQAHLGLDPLELDLHLTAQLEVEGAERLVEQEHLGAVDQGPGHGDPLLLTTGELGRLARGQVISLHELQRLVGLRGGVLVPRRLGPKATLSRTSGAGRGRSSGRPC